MLNPYHLPTALWAHNEAIEQSMTDALRRTALRPNPRGRNRRLLSDLGALLVAAGLRLQGQV